MPFVMRCLYAFIVALIGYTAPAQPGFNEAYDLGALAAAFGSLELSGDTLVVYGTAIEEGQPAFGMLFARFDTSGNLIDYRIHYDSLGKHFTGVFPNSFIKLSDGSGYAGVGQFFNPQNGYFARFAINGDLIGFKEIVDSIYTNNIFNQIIEITDGFLVGGTDYTSTLNSTFLNILKIDITGECLWEKKIQNPDRLNLFGSIIIVDDNEYVIASSTTTKPVITPLPQTQNTSKIFAIDSLGNIKWQWESPPSLEELGAGSIFRTPDGNWAYTSARGWYNATYNEISRQPKFIIRDENFNIIREDTFGIADFPINGFRKGSLLNDGGWLLIGVKPVHYPIPPVPMWYNSFSGWMVRLDSQGDQLWSRIDTAFWSYETGSTNYYYDAVELPSGSLVVCGYSRTYEPAPKDWGWLIKVSKDGCVDTLLCTPISSISIQQETEFNIKIYPNPASSLIHIESNHFKNWDRIEVFNSVGQALQTFTNAGNTSLDISQLPNGVYFIRFTKDGQLISRKIIKS